MQHFRGEGKDRDVLYHKSSFTGAGLEQDGEFWKNAMSR